MPKRWVSSAFAASDHDYSEGTYIYNQHYLNLEWIPEVGCVPNGTLGLGPFSVTIDRFETDEESGVEVVYGAFSGTVYIDNLAERLTSCTTPPNISARLSGRFKLPVDRFGGLPDGNVPEEEQDIELVPLMPPG